MFDQRKRAHVFISVPQQIECEEIRLTTTEQEIIELRSAVFIEAHDLAIEQHRLALHRIGDVLSQAVKARERVAVARYEAAGTVLDIGQSAKAAVLELKDPVWMADGLAEARQAPGFNGRENHLV